MALIAAACVPIAPTPIFGPIAGRGINAGIEVQPSAGCATDGPAAAGTSAIDVEGVPGNRKALLHLPEGISSNDDAPRPLLVSLHPFTTTADQWEELSGLSSAANDRGYIAVSPYGSQPGPRWQVPGGLDANTDDMGFIAELLNQIEDTHCVDRNSIVAAGYSAGAAMSQGLGCVMPWRFAGVAGSGGMNLTNTCADSDPTNAFTLHGTVDPVVPLSGSLVPFAPPLGLSIAETVATNAERGDCTPQPSVGVPELVIAEDYSCLSGHTVRYWKMQGAGHTWAGSTPGLDLFVGPTLQTFSANEAVLDFFDSL